MPCERTFENLWHWVSLNICYATSHIKDVMSQPTFDRNTQNRNARSVKLRPKKSHQASLRRHKRWRRASFARHSIEEHLGK